MLLGPVEVEASTALPSPLPPARPIMGHHSNMDKSKYCPQHTAETAQLPMLSPQHEVTEAFHNPKAAKPNARNPSIWHQEVEDCLSYLSHISALFYSSSLFFFFLTAVELSFNTPDLYKMSFYLKIWIHGNRTALHSDRQFTAQQRTRTGRKQPTGG